jgi:hypothetical protein
MNAFTSISKPVENAALRVLSFGAGVQSTVLLLMAAKGEIKPMFDVAIFADTQFEPASIYLHLDWCKEELKKLTNDRVQLEKVTAGNLKENEINHINLNGTSFSSIPYFTDTGLGRRQCTADYKIKPIRQSIRNKLGVLYKQKVPRNTFVEQWIGISTDELERVKDARDKWVVHRYPLIEMGMSRGDCYQWFKKHYPHKELAKSACIACPYHHNSMWRDMKKNDPVSWEEACQFDEAIRNVASNKVTQYVHNSATPLRTADLGDEHTPDLFLGECDGMCGV